MPEDAPEGYTHIEDAVTKWGRNRGWWYDQVKEGPPNGLTGYKIAGLRGTYLKDAEVEEFLKPRPMQRPDAQIG